MRAGYRAHKMIGLLGFEFSGDGEEFVRIALPYVVARIHFCVVHGSTQGGGKTTSPCVACAEEIGRASCRERVC